MGRQLTDSVYGACELFPIQEDLSQTEVLRKTKNLTQLGLAKLLYPSAEHSRYMHSIGSGILGGMYAEKLGVNEEERNTLVAALTLHDLGHYPFCHTVDAFFEKIFGNTHEGNSVYLIKNSAEVLDILGKYKVNPEKVCRLIDGKDGLGFMQQLVSGTMDCDRLDYLQRDSIGGTARYGLAIDIKRFLQGAKKSPDGKLYYTQDTADAIKHFLSVYVDMYLAVYRNRNIVAADTMLNKALELREDTFKRVKFSHLTEERIISYLLNKRSSNKRQEKAKELAMRIFGKFRPYKDIFSIPMHLKSQTQLYDEIADKFGKKDGAIDKNIVEHALIENLKNHGIEEGDILVISKEIPKEDERPKTDIFIEPYYGSTIEDIVRIEDLRDDIPITINRKYCDQFAFRVIVPEERSKDPKLRKKIGEILFS